MREILFRGKRLKIEDWVIGSLITYQDGDCYIARPSDDPNVLDKFCVDQSTVGQYTGLKDKNGNRIFEGDMLKPFDDEFDKMVVEFHHGCFMLCIYGERGYMGESGWCEEGNYGVIECESLSSYGDNIEVVGNIHDNQEPPEEG